MSRIAFRIATDARTYPADDLSGAGAERTGGRWNEPGVAVVYASESRALACLETIVHLGASALPLNRYLVEIMLPDRVWAAREEQDAASLPVGWDADPASLTSIGFGTAWLRAGRSPLLCVPSAIVPEERNLLLNPAHPLMQGVVARKRRRWSYDSRLVAPSGR
ncbi:RES family NAD+ phosphorylase [Acetobacteraceae bacterium KSS8]|uniref:RES family NAD+ phosphorylase n=1 Tax=Endosaccharibacter trunci TaxID=2812733 RepID=A0ABT1W399_9PROT|nr:RES family NAD+ phosphorylase [Acetobacteraceae bacterium KSS8]